MHYIGIATRFDLATLPIKNIWFQATVHAPEHSPAILDAFAKWQIKEDTKASAVVSLAPTAGTIVLVYSAPMEKPAVFQSFYEIPVLQTVIPSTLGTVAQLNAISAGLVDTGIPMR